MILRVRRPTLIKSKVEEQNLHKSLRFIFVIAQVFGFFPVQGVLKENVNSLGFTWFSVRVLSSIITCLGGILCTMGHIRHITTIDGYEQHQMNAIIFYSCGTLSCICFIKLSKDWREIMLKWQEVDRAMSSYGWPETLDRRLTIISIIFLLFEAAEHFLIQANKLIVAVKCHGSFSKGFEYYAVVMSFSMIFDLIGYAPWIAIVFQAMNTRMAFSWTFIDLFIILMSCSLAQRFRQINERIQRMRNMNVTSEQSWGSVNEDYNRLCKLCDFVDDKISWLILVSFFNNFYFIIFQVFASLNLHLATTLETIYYFISLGLLIMRMVFICLYGSWVHDESKVPMDLLASTPHGVYNKEIVKLCDSIKYQTTGLTGKKTFLISKSLILKITSVVVTYELVVIQFNKNIPQKDQPSIYSLC